MQLPQKVGVNLFLARRFHPEEYPYIVAKLKELKITSVREEISLREVFSPPGGFERYDRAFQMLHQQGFRILLLISDPPAPPSSLLEPSQTPLASAISTVIYRYHPVIHEYQILNEVNTQRFWGSEPNARDYAILVRQIRNKIRNLSGITLISAGLAGPDLPYLEKLFSEGGAEVLDAFAFHPYSFPSPLKGTDLELSTEFVRRIKPKPTYITEIGWPTSTDRYGISEFFQARYLEEFLSLSSHIGAEYIFWYDFRDDGDDPNYFEHRMGLLDRDNREKPAFFSLKNWLSQPPEKKNTPPLLPLRIIQKIPFSSPEIPFSIQPSPNADSYFIQIEGLPSRVFPAEFQCLQVSLSTNLVNWFIGYRWRFGEKDFFEGVMTRIVWRGERTVTAFLPMQDSLIGKSLQLEGIILSPAKGFTPPLPGYIQIFSTALCAEEKGISP
ncbi:MAG: hypothetical protein ACK4G3_00725 [bacterium]